MRVVRYNTNPSQMPPNIPIRQMKNGCCQGRNNTYYTPVSATLEPPITVVSKQASGVIAVL